MPDRLKFIAALAALSAFFAAPLFAARNWKRRAGSAAPARAAQPALRGARVTVNRAAGSYRISLPVAGWRFQGSVGAPLTGVQRFAGRDRIGAYRAVRLDWLWHGLPVSGLIQCYAGRPLVLFRLIYQRATAHPRLAFPDFTREPRGLYAFSYRNRAFSAPQFRAGRSGSPWLLFDRHRNAALLSPAGHFQVTELEGDGVRRSALRLARGIAAVPAGYNVECLLAAAHGINAAYRLWGRALTRFTGRQRPTNEADLSLRDLGYWTDNGATYYYHYRPALGYTGTLLAELRSLRARRIPVRYLQLDSWWYRKDALSYNGRVLTSKNPFYHPARWNIYGGVWKYKASRTLFPGGLAAFHRQAGLPFITHGRWISQRSPYHRQYRIAGIAPVDTRYWRHIAGYLRRAGVVTYEQDWLNFIRRYSGFRNHPGVGSAFFDDMAAAMRRKGMTLQYCMPTPAEILQGAMYSNLTTTRVSDDKFIRARWTDFLYVSRLASALGIWPWADVATSREPDAILLQTLSAGPVGFGDGIGRARRRVLMQAVRADGRIVKPDAALVPIGADYLNAARGRRGPTLGRTYTDQDGVKTAYVFAFARGPADIRPVRFTARQIGLRGGMYVYDYFRRQGQWVPAGREFAARLGQDASAYYLCATPGASGIAFLGDADQFVGTGRERMPMLRQTRGGVRATLLFAAGETRVRLHGWARSRPSASVVGGRAGQVVFNPRTGRFRVTISVAPARTLRATQVRLWMARH